MPFELEKTSVKLCYKKECINSREIDIPFKSYEQMFRQIVLEKKFREIKAFFQKRTLTIQKFRFCINVV